MLQQLPVVQVKRTVKLQVMVYTDYTDTKGRVAFEASGVDAYTKVVDWMAKVMIGFFYGRSAQQWELKSVIETEVSNVA